MIVSRRNTLLCASVLGMGALSSVAHAATESTHTSSHVRHKTVTHGPVRSAATPATTAPVSVARPVAAPQFSAPVAVNRSHAVRSIDSGTQESVVVTGSALSTSNNQNANPVQVITSKQIEQTGANTLGDYLQRLPSVGSSGTTNSQTNGTAGVSCIDLRNLGQKRVLVLIDGKRAAMDGSASCFDMNTINVHQVASVEILKDGGSELYGADAVSGVINIKLKHNLDDANLTVRGGITDRGDGQSGMISGYKAGTSIMVRATSRSPALT
ncbi:TonB-denpendent receptor [Gluconobacter japonicus]|nr:TonB-denpendent receptor [Gluconobacter japonicus]